MKKNILEFLENTAYKLPNKVAFIYKDHDITFKDFTEKSKIIGSGINKKIFKTNKPIAVFYV